MLITVASRATIIWVILKAPRAHHRVVGDVAGALLIVATA
jgi:hypothetical protein